MKKIFINAGNLKTRICKWGKKENQTIICLHGQGSSNLSFLEIGNLLKWDYYVLSIDLPGHGETDSFPKDKDYEMPNLVSWLSEVIKMLGEENLYILGHDWGGDIALYYAFEWPRQVKKIALLDVGYYSGKRVCHRPFSGFENIKDDAKKDFETYVFNTWKEIIKEEKKRYIRWSPLLEVAVRDLMKEEEDGIKCKVTDDTARSVIRSMYLYPSEAIADKLSMDILLLQSTLSENPRKRRDALSRMISTSLGGTVKEIPDTTHMLHWDRPEKITEEINEWFKDDTYTLAGFFRT